LKKFRKKLETFEQENNVKFYKRDCRSLEAAKLRAIKKKDSFTNLLIKYYELRYCCIHAVYILC
jgi:hypothetical protein